MIKRDPDGTERIVGRGGNYLTWWRKDKEGKWRVILDTGTPEPLDKPADKP